MTYPQSGSGSNYGQQYGQGQYGQQPYGQGQYGQNEYGQNQYGQADQQGSDQQGQYGYSQPAGQQGYGQQGYGQYGQQSYGQPSAGQYGQQNYGQQQGYGAPAPSPASPGLPANTTTILAGVVGGLGVLMLFLGFLAGSKTTLYYGFGERQTVSVKLFQTTFVGPWLLLALAGVLALLTFLLGHAKWVTGAIAALSVVSALSTVFIFATADNTGIGSILLLVFSILALLASVFWLLIEGGQLKVAPVAATPAAAATAAPAASAQAAAPGQPAASQGYGYDAASYQTPSVTTGEQSGGYSQHADPLAANPQSSPNNATPSAYGQQYGGSVDATTAYQAPGSGSDEIGATTAFVKPDTDPGESAKN
ncbi:MAG: DUF5336 domain-containing protein [Gordonia sp. (in: high G+C Gram-positive bacteria)]